MSLGADGERAAAAFTRGLAALGRGPVGDSDALQGVTRCRG